MVTVFQVGDNDGPNSILPAVTVVNNSPVARVAGKQGFNISVPASNYSYQNMDVALLPNERSVLVLIGANLGNVGDTIAVSIIGDQSNAVYYTGNVAPEAKYFGPVNQMGYPPISAPAYGSEDTSITVSFGIAHGSPIAAVFTATVIAIPDPDISGSPGNPEFVELVANGSPVGINNPLYVIQQAAPSSLLQIATLTGATSGTALAGPAQGYKRIIDHISYFAGDLNTSTGATLGLAANPTTGHGIYIPARPTYAPAGLYFSEGQPAKIPLYNGQTLYYSVPNTADVLNLAYHDESL